MIEIVLKEKTKELEALGTQDGIILTERGTWSNRGIGSRLNKRRLLLQAVGQS